MVYPNNIETVERAQVGAHQEIALVGFSALHFSYGVAPTWLAICPCRALIEINPTLGNRAAARIFSERFSGCHSSACDASPARLLLREAS